MTTNYVSLASDLSVAVRAFARDLREDESVHPDLEQGANHLDVIGDNLDDIDEDGSPQDPRIPRVLAESAAVANQVVDFVVDRAQGNGRADALATLEKVVRRVREVGCIAPDPTSLEWFGDAVPADGSN